MVLRLCERTGDDVTHRCAGEVAPRPDAAPRPARTGPDGPRWSCSSTSCSSSRSASPPSELHHALTEAHVVEGLLAYAFVFFGIWWAWMNFTWFATSFDTDDWLYRVLTIVQMAGVLILAAGHRARLHRP